MQKSMYPCLWFNNEAAQAAAFYTSVFNQAEILKENEIVSTFQLSGTKFMALNGGPQYQKTPAVSYYVYCGSEQEIDRLYEVLSKEGTVMMPLDKYDWTKKFAWVADRYGVNWQLDIDDINAPQKIVPSLLFANEKYKWVKKAITHYASIFPSSETLLEMPYPKEANRPGDTLLFAQFKLAGFIFNAMSSHIQHDFDFSPGNSFVVECETQQQIDHYWEKLGEGGRFEVGGWLQDKFGVSWQIIPSVLPDLLMDPEKGPEVATKAAKMKKLDIQKLKAI
ncbi:MAG: VOC family protein [Bacteroidales bacterium]|nr:VOC family protein [Bacteroidales bacterium]MCF8334349.1 VOC family protein [Bacteroidales bacterium]